MIAAIEAPEEGSIHVRSVRLDTRELPLQVRRDITLVFQRPLLVAGSVRTNVQYGLKLRGTVRQSSHKVDKLLHRLGLERLADQSASTLSGGQVQLVALARALAVEPSILLLDEPTANLDPAHVALVEQTIIEDQQERGTTVIWTTHNLFQARRVAQRVGLLLNGQLIETASTQEFFESPSDPRTADFVLGKMIY
jgi:tungstate transport system ATP-binding protein